MAIGGNVSGARAASDLRFFIEKMMSKNGVIIVYPQRDVHLDSAKPLKIELVSDRPDTSTVRE